MKAPATETKEGLIKLLVQFERSLQDFFSEKASRYSCGESLEHLYLELTEFVSRKAKRIRPVLFLASHSLFSNVDPKINRAAIALELLHTFILIHDDIIDRSERRRGLPTFHKLVEHRLGNRTGKERIGQGVALVMGDLAYALAFESFLEGVEDNPAGLVAMRRLLGYVTDTGCGEILDILQGVRDVSQVPLEDIESMYHLKTTRYTIECPLVLGALVGGASQEALQAIEAFAKPVGLAFQIQNDLQEFKHFDLSDAMFQSDLLEGKKTMLARLTFDRLDETGRSFLQLCLNNPALAEPSIHKIRELIRKSGAEDLLAQRVLTLFTESESHLNTPALTTNQREGLLAMVHHVRQQTAI